ncbi:MAG TPA: hypothetical protein VGG48_16770 [Rhizomicrobium sp.]|jgi:hypothetical protein
MILIVHIAAGSLGILSGFAALLSRKGRRAHRAFGTVFVIAILTMAAMGAALAIAIPQRATTIVAILAFYFVATAWVTVRREEGSIGLFEKTGVLVPLGAAASLFVFGVQAQMAGKLEGVPSLPYFAFAGFAASIAILDIKVIRQGGVRGAARIARHLWRMCAALLFACANFFLGQQKVMPLFLHGSPVLFLPEIVVLCAMIYWLIRVRVPPRRLQPVP